MGTYAETGDEAGFGTLFDLSRVAGDLRSMDGQHVVLEMCTVVGFPYGGVLRPNSVTDRRDMGEMLATGKCPRMRIAYAWDVNVKPSQDVGDCCCEDACCADHVRSTRHMADSRGWRQEQSMWKRRLEPGNMDGMCGRNNVVLGLIGANNGRLEPRPSGPATDVEWNIDAVEAMNSLAMVNDPSGFGKYLSATSADDGDPRPNVLPFHVKIFNVPCLFYITRRRVYQYEEVLVSYGESYFQGLSTQSAILNSVKNQLNRTHTEFQAKKATHKILQEKGRQLRQEIRKLCCENGVVIEEDSSASTMLAGIREQELRRGNVLASLAEQARAIQRNEAETLEAKQAVQRLQLEREEHVSVIVCANARLAAYAAQLARERAQRAFGASQMVDSTPCPYSLAANYYGNGNVHILGNNPDQHYRSRCQYAKLFADFVVMCPRCLGRFLASPNLEEGQVPAHNRVACGGNIAKHFELLQATGVTSAGEGELLERHAAYTQKAGHIMADFKKALDPLVFFFLKALVVAIIGGTCLDDRYDEPSIRLQSLGQHEEVVQFPNSLATVCKILHGARASVFGPHLPQALTWVLDFAAYVVKMEESDNGQEAVLEAIARLSQAYDKVTKLLFCSDQECANVMIFSLVSHCREPLVEITFKSLNDSLRCFTRWNADRLQSAVMPPNHNTSQPNSLKRRLRRVMEDLLRSFVVADVKTEGADRRRRRYSEDITLSPQHKRPKLDAVIKSPSKTENPVDLQDEGVCVKPETRERIFYVRPEELADESRIVAGWFAGGRGHVRISCLPSFVRRPSGDLAMVLFLPQMGLELSPAIQLLGRTLRLSFHRIQVPQFHQHLSKKSRTPELTVFCPLFTVDSNQRLLPLLSVRVTANESRLVVGGNSLFEAESVLPWDFIALPSAEKQVLTMTLAERGRLQCCLAGHGTCVTEACAPDARLHWVGPPQTQHRERSKGRRKILLHPASIVQILSVEMFQ
ncbi:MAG: uncharacterized protein KVP18_001778 [Porospora cf. gigantea A]|uniref:uncharacterized protein n=1 Tax=Porospora cf. gigantea A TaxID=2853593 RepID=UPI0035598459|nr:MAG: hypothetical protein KVP18_001778 [Porospora cf. gigantea A]